MAHYKLLFVATSEILALVPHRHLSDAEKSNAAAHQMPSEQDAVLLSVDGPSLEVRHLHKKLHKICNRSNFFETLKPPPQKFLGLSL